MLGELAVLAQSAREADEAGVLESHDTAPDHCSIAPALSAGRATG